MRVSHLPPYLFPHVFILDPSKAGIPRRSLIVDGPLTSPLVPGPHEFQAPVQGPRPRTPRPLHRYPSHSPSLANSRGRGRPCLGAIRVHFRPVPLEISPMARTSSVCPSPTCACDFGYFVPVRPVVIHVHLAWPILVTVNSGTYQTPLVFDTRGTKIRKESSVTTRRPSVTLCPTDLAAPVTESICPLSHVSIGLSVATLAVHLVLRATGIIQMGPGCGVMVFELLDECPTGAARPCSSVSPTVSGTATIRTHQWLSQSRNLLPSSDLHAAAVKPIPRSWLCGRFPPRFRKVPGGVIPHTNTVLQKRHGQPTPWNPQIKSAYQ